MARRLDITAVFDIETQDWDKFVCGGYYDGTHYRRSWDESEFAEWVLSTEGAVWAWNGGLYDTIWLADWLQRQGRRYQCQFAGTRITRLAEGACIVRDAAALFPCSLQKASGVLGSPISKDTGLECACGAECGGYCRIRRIGMSPREQQSLEEYLECDVVTTWRVLECLRSHAESYGYSLTGTIGGSAWLTAKETLGIDSASWLSGREYNVARAGYYGGRVFVGRLSYDIGLRYDINSAYPAALSTVAIPFGEYAVLDGGHALRAFARSRPGIYHCRVRVPDSLIPPLPWRSPDNRICYPIGVVDGAWALNELTYAVEEIGCEVLSVSRAIVWSDEEVIFDTFTAEIFRVRAIYGKEHPLGVWQKFLGNSLTGKFAERPLKQRFIANPEAEEIAFCNPMDPRCSKAGCTVERCTGFSGGWSPINFHGAGTLWQHSYYRLSDCAHVQWAAYLTAETRIKWHRAAVAVGEDNVLYGDTDSLYTKLPLPDSFVGDAFGFWSYEGMLEDWHCIAPKSYNYKALEKDVARGKGIPNISPALWHQFAGGATVSMERGVRGLKSAARGGDELFTRKKITRRHHGRRNYCGDRGVDSDGVTYPLTCREHEQRIEREREQRKERESARRESERRGIVPRRVRGRDAEL